MCEFENSLACKNVFIRNFSLWQKSEKKVAFKYNYFLYKNMLWQVVEKVINSDVRNL